MARSSKYLYYKKQDGTSGCVPLYTNTDCFSCVAGYYKPLGVKCGSETYYIPTMSTEIPSNPSGMRYQDYYVDRVNYKPVIYAYDGFTRCKLYYDQEYPVYASDVGRSVYLTRIACLAYHFLDKKANPQRSYNMWEYEENLNDLPSMVCVFNVKCVTESTPNYSRNYELGRQSDNAYLTTIEYHSLVVVLCSNSYVTYEGGSVVDY